MSKNACLILSVVTAAVMSTAVARAEAPLHDSNLIPWYRDVRGPGCSPTDDSVGVITADTLPTVALYQHNRSGSPTPAASCRPLLAPDGHQLTLGEFKAVVGGALVKCIAEGSHTVLRFSGLQLNGVYNVWLAVVNPNPASGGPYLSAGSLGKAALSENRVLVSAAGDGQITRVTPEQDQSVAGHIGACALDSAIEIHLVYHNDQQTHGPVPGPQDTWVVNARFRIP